MKHHVCRKPSPRWTSPLLAFAVVAAAAGFAVDRPHAQTAAKHASEPVPCLIEARSRIKLSASVAGLVERVHVDRGDRIRVGQVLVEMEASVERAQLALAEARAANRELIASAEARALAARRASDRYVRLRRASPGAVTDTRFEEAEMEALVAEANFRDAQTNLDSARLEAQRARALLALRTIRSPVDGVVVERVMSPGEYRNEQSHFLSIAAIDPLHVEVFLPVAWYTQVRRGDSALVRPAAPIGGEHLARISVLDSVIDAPSGTFGLRLELPNPTGAIPAGLRCSIVFDVAG